MRRTLLQARSEFNGALEDAIGACANDVPKIAGFVNRAQQQLINAGGETGFWGGWAKVVFAVCREHPYITLPAQFARVINMAACRTGMRIQNEFYEYLEAGIGLQPGTPCHNWCGAFEGYERGVVPTMLDLTPTNQYITVFITDPSDVGKTIVFQNATDQNGNGIYSQLGSNSVIGFPLTLDSPSVSSNFIVTGFNAIVKDPTAGDVLVYQTDATTGAQVLLSRFGPNETNPAYRRYYINRLPCSCAPCLPVSPCLAPNSQPPPKVLVSALAKYEYFPALRDTDNLIIGNIPALIEECQAIRYSTMDAAGSVGMQQAHHLAAIRHLNNELRHYLGELNPAVNFAPFGTARLCRPMSAVRYG